MDIHLPKGFEMTGPPEKDDEGNLHFTFRAVAPRKSRLRPFWYEPLPRRVRRFLNRHLQCATWTDGDQGFRCMRWRHRGDWHADCLGREWHAEG
jgi:hypothetical protein